MALSAAKATAVLFSRAISAVIFRTLFLHHIGIALFLILVSVTLQAFAWVASASGCITCSGGLKEGQLRRDVPFQADQSRTVLTSTQYGNPARAALLSLLQGLRIQTVSDSSNSLAMFPNATSA